MHILGVKFKFPLGYFTLLSRYIKSNKILLGSAFCAVHRMKVRNQIGEKFAVDCCVTFYQTYPMCSFERERMRISRFGLLNCEWNFCKLSVKVASGRKRFCNKESESGLSSGEFQQVTSHRLDGSRSWLRFSLKLQLDNDVVSMMQKQREHFDPHDKNTFNALSLTLFIENFVHECSSFGLLTSQFNFLLNDNDRLKFTPVIVVSIDALITL